MTECWDNETLSDIGQHHFCL